MENLDMDKLLCNLTFQEYIARKKMLELKLKLKTVDNNQELQSINEKMIELKECAYYLNNLKLQYCLEQNTEKTR